MTDRRSPTRSSLVDDAAAAFAAYRDGDEQRMGELVDLVTPLLWHSARGQGASPQQASDAVQTTWLRLVEKADTVRDPQAVVAWLTTTLRRTVISDARRRRDVVVDLTEPQHDRAAPDPDPSTLVALDERQRLLWRHVESLDERCRHLLRMVASAGRPNYAAVATALGMPVGSIGPTRGRCLTKLRTLLDGDARWEGLTDG